MVVSVLVVVLGVAPLATAAPSEGRTQGPCDIYMAAESPCVAAFSTTRALSATYRGPLYQLERASDRASLNIGVLPDGYADAAAHDEFCTGTTCVFSKVFDQSPNHNDLGLPEPLSFETHGLLRLIPFHLLDASLLPIVIAGHKVYGMYFDGEHSGYRNNQTANMPIGDQPEGMYMVAGGDHFNSTCCFDFGNAETDDTDDGAGTMDAVNLSTICWFPNGVGAMPNFFGGVPPDSQCKGGGPFVQADLENGLYGSNTGVSQDPGYVGEQYPYVTAMLKNDGTNFFALKGGNAQSGVLSTRYAGPLPPKPFVPNPADGNGYSPMRKQGAIILGTGGDGGSGAGDFFEGVITRNLPTDEAENAVHANIVAAGYGSPAPTR